MPILHHQSLITIAGVRTWSATHRTFKVRYDLVRKSSSKAPPSYNCIYLVGDAEHVLVSTNTTEGLVHAREMGLYPLVLKTHHRDFGDGTLLTFDSATELISSWKKSATGQLDLVLHGLDQTETNTAD